MINPNSIRSTERQLSTATTGSYKRKKKDPKQEMQERANTTFKILRVDGDGDKGGGNPNRNVGYLEMEPSASDSAELDIGNHNISMIATSASNTFRQNHFSAKLATLEEEDDGEFDEAGAKVIGCAAGSMTCAALLPLLMFL